MSIMPESGGESAQRRRMPGGGGARPQRLKVPRAVWALLGIMLILHLLRLSLPEEQAFEIVYALALIVFEQGQPLDPARFYTLVTHAFLHANWAHIFFNGLWLLILGSRLHQELGEVRFLLFFALTAAAGGATQLFFDWGQLTVVIGASGAVFGLLGAGAYLWVLQPGDRGRERIKKLAWYCAVMMLLNVGYAAVGGMGGIEKIAWEAHAGGFFAGLAVFPLLRRRRPLNRVEPGDDA